MQTFASVLEKETMNMEGTIKYTFRLRIIIIIIIIDSTAPSGP
jgi:hypothetical protein